MEAEPEVGLSFKTEGMPTRPVSPSTLSDASQVVVDQKILHDKINTVSFQTWFRETKRQIEQQQQQQEQQQEVEVIMDTCVIGSAEIPLPRLDSVPDVLRFAFLAYFTWPNLVFRKSLCPRLGCRFMVATILLLTLTSALVLYLVVEIIPDRSSEWDDARSVYIRTPDKNDASEHVPGWCTHLPLPRALSSSSSSSSSSSTSLSSFDPVELVQLVTALVMRHSVMSRGTTTAHVVDSVLMPALAVDMHTLRSLVLDTIDIQSTTLLLPPCSTHSCYQQVHCDNVRDTTSRAMMPVVSRMADMWYRVGALQGHMLHLAFQSRLPHLPISRRRMRLSFDHFAGRRRTQQQQQQQQHGLDSCMVRAQSAVARLEVILETSGRRLRIAMLDALSLEPELTARQDQTPVDDRVLRAIDTMNSVRSLWARRSNVTLEPVM